MFFEEVVYKFDMGMRLKRICDFVPEGYIKGVKKFRLFGDDTVVLLTDTDKVVKFRNKVHVGHYQYETIVKDM